MTMMSTQGGVASPDKVARGVLDSLLEGCQVIGFDWTYLYVNRTAAAHGRSPREELIGRTMMSCYPGIEKTPLFASLRQCMSERSHHRLENEFAYPDGTVAWFELRIIPVPDGVCVLSLDITAKKQTEAALARSEDQLRHAQKMEAVGRLAGGVAHDFNNLLSVILSYTEILLADLTSDDPLRADVAEVNAAGKRAAEVTRQLLAFSRHRAMEPRILDLNQVLAGMETMVSRVLGADVEVTWLPSCQGRVTTDAGHVEQIVMNLAINARDAMPNGGKLTIQTNDVELDAGYASTHLGVAPGPYVMLALTDSGVGMTKETQSHIFEPFFTTKERASGSGLGLSTVFGIIQQCGGHVCVYSEPGKGTTFKVYFPRTLASPEGPFPGAVEPTSAQGNETILLVEDDAQVREVARGILRRSGYVVLDAESSGEALLASEQYGAKIHLLLTDVVLPRMNGPELAARLGGSRPEMRVLLMSGYTDEAIMQHGLIDSDVAFLQKPLTPGSLNRKVREVLGSRRSVRKT
jgi:two-component system cell cycle sensor histidine kinase/response regulator CckA